MLPVALFRAHILAFVRGRVDGDIPLIPFLKHGEIAIVLYLVEYHGLIVPVRPELLIFAIPFGSHRVFDVILAARYPRLNRVGAIDEQSFYQLVILRVNRDIHARVAFGIFHGETENHVVARHSVVVIELACHRHRLDAFGRTFFPILVTALLERNLRAVILALVKQGDCAVVLGFFCGRPA